MGETIDETGKSVLIEAVYYRYFHPHVEEFDTVEEAERFLEFGEEEGDLSGVGVFVEGELVRSGAGLDIHEPVTSEQAAAARVEYDKAKAAAAD